MQLVSYYKLTMTLKTSSVAKSTLYPPTLNSSDETLCWWNMASYIHLNLQHLLSWLLQLCPIWSTFIDVTTPIHSTHGCLCNKGLIWSLGKDHIMIRLQKLHWLPFCARITFKISLLVHHIVSGTSTSYIAFTIMPCSISSYKILWSSFTVLRTNQTFGSCIFSVPELIQYGTVSQLQLAFALSLRQNLKKDLSINIVL